jgi:hypothetical protein
MPVRLFVWPPTEDAEIPKDYVGVTIESWGDNGVHVGIIYRTSQGGVWILHHRGHFDLQHGPPSDGQIIAVCPIDPLEAPIIARFFRQLYRYNRNGFPYGFNSAAAQWFSDDGTFTQPGGTLGFCCQTFVLAAYMAAGTPLIDPADPAPREDDVGRQIALLDSLQMQLDEARPETKRHFAAVRAAAGSSLCRPMEVGGAALAEAIPCAFMNAQELALQIAALLNG